MVNDESASICPSCQSTLVDGECPFEDSHEESEEDFWQTLNAEYVLEQPRFSKLNAHGDHAIDCFCEVCMRNAAIAKALWIIISLSVIIILIMGVLS